MAAHVAAGATGRTSPHAGDDLAHLSAPELVARYQQGDRRALVELVPRMRESVIGHIAHHLSDPSEVEDLAHDVLAHALAHLEAVDADRGLWPWLVAMANNRIIDHHRQYDTAHTRVDDVRVRETLVPSTRARAEDAFETVELREQRRTLFRMLRHLAPRQRAALVLHAVHGWDADQIAELLGTNRNNVHQLLARARGRARREYLSLTGGHRPWAVVPWPLLWARDRIRRALQRTRDTVTEWQGALPAAGESVSAAASMAVTVAVVAGMTWAGGGPPSAEASPGPSSERVHAMGALDELRLEALARQDAGGLAASDVQGSPVSDGSSGLSRAEEEMGDSEAPPEGSGPGTSLPEPGVSGPTVGEPAKATIETRDSDEFEDGQHTAIDVEVADGSVVHTDGDTDCSRDYTRPACHPEDSVDDTTTETTDTGGTESDANELSGSSSDDAPDDDDVDNAVSNEMDSTLTDDNCSLDPTVGEVCEAADEV